jgi:hypothetical protein
MRSLAVGSVVTLILVTGLFVSQVEAKNDNNDRNDDKGNNKQEFKNEDKGKNKQEFKFVGNDDKPKLFKHDDDRSSVPEPGTLLALGGGLVGLMAWRARQRKPRA